MVVIRSPLTKDILRDIRKSLGRFLSIVSIVALGVAFFAGLKIAPQDMRFTADKYYDDYKLMDIRIVSSLGLTEGDLEAIEEVDGVESSFATFTMDALTEVNDREIVVKVHSYESEDQINGAKLLEGRYPKSVDECIIEARDDSYLDVPLGSKIELSSGKKEPISEDLFNTEFTVVGKVTSPYYLSFEKGNSSIGSGQVRDFIMIPQSNFKSNIFTDIYLTVQGARQLNSYDSEYFKPIDSVTSKLKKLSKNREVIRYEELLDDISAGLDEGKSDYYKGKEESERELSKGLIEIEKAKSDLLAGEVQLRDKEREFYSQISEGKDRIQQGEKDIVEGEKQLGLAFEEFNKEKTSAEESFNKVEKEIKIGEEYILVLEASREEINSQLNIVELPEDREELLKDLQEVENKLFATREAVGQAKLGLEAGRNELNRAEEKLKREQELLLVAKNELESEKVNIVKLEQEALEEFKVAKEKLVQADRELKDGERKLLETKAKVENELADAWKDIEEGEKELKDIEKGKWYVLDRKSHYSYMDYGGAADRIEAIAKLFPVFFALVAALVCLTTMTRMVDEQRINIGTLKALGYTNSSIALKYIVYALLATLLGCIIGISIGYTLFPTVIFNAYGMMYELPPVILIFNKILALSITIASITLTTGTAYLAALNELKENPANLMRPKAPKLGKEIFIEKFPIIWSRFNFSYKVTIRNIFRYKRRFFMTVFGIAGCTALILTGFGVKDSIRTIVDRQYGNLLTYDITIGVDKNIDEHLYDNEKVTDYTYIHREGVAVKRNDKELDVSLIVPENLNKISRFINLQDRKTSENIDIPRDGVIVSEQIAKLLDIRVGDEFNLLSSENVEATVKVRGITENYTFNYVYLSPDYYREIFATNLKYEEIIGHLKSTVREIEESLAKDLVLIEGVNSVSFTSTLKENFEDTINSLNYVVLIMIVSAGALAFVVLYNLTNVNISERIREIATIKVLGFYDSEVSEYIYRENIILTIFGIFSGLFMGIFLHRYIMTTVEMENMMFGLTLDWKSYLYAIALTFMFSVFVNFAMHYKLKGVEMVESLKSVD